MFTDKHFKTLFCINVNACIDYIYDSKVNLHFYKYCRKNILQNTKKVNNFEMNNNFFIQIDTFNNKAK